MSAEAGRTRFSYKKLIRKILFQDVASPFQMLLTLISRRSSSSFAFAGCGWLSPFYLGVVKQMKKEGVLDQQSICSGTSGGALAATIAVNNISCDQALQYLIEASTDKVFRKDIHGGLKRLLRDILPTNVHEISNHRLIICVTKVWPQFNHPVLISNFDSRENLIDVIAASCFIPVYSNPKMLAAPIQPFNQRFISTENLIPFLRNLNIKTNSFSQDEMNGLFIDGGVTAWIPPIGDIRVAPFKTNRLGRIISKVNIILSSTVSHLIHH
jgi:hypothetical protein